ncbi:ER membrane glycoprotein subunit of the GPI transamidase complex-like protein [Arachnomyces sp. PD_36]|nr:ER membrane glycoprotein subunit of the GPI transamidase complex-like protein [Arachnomyces sp. PD_36]
MTPKTHPPTRWENLCNFALTHPAKALAVSFIVWKFLLLVIIVCSPGPGYDTSTTLLSSGWTGETTLSSAPWRFVRWDSIYYLRMAERGNLFEQEWAFGYGYTRMLSLFGSGEDGVLPLAIAGIGISHICHFLSVLILYALTKNVFGSSNNDDGAFCFVSAALHIISPAGAFLSAPYGEAIFSFLNFAGFYVYCSALLDERRGNSVRRSAKHIVAGALFAAATTNRSNGLLSGALFAYDAVFVSLRIVTSGISFDRLLHLLSIIMGGIIVALGVLWPQYVAYTLYCGADVVSRPWCEKAIPSIYGWVQSHYWNVGFLRYWTISNLPLFCLAIPILTLLIRSSIWALSGEASSDQLQYGKAEDKELGRYSQLQDCLTRLALPQGLLAIMALLVYHVQIITRISSGYPLWYWYLASRIFRRSATNEHPAKGVEAKLIVQVMVLYGLIQGGLFASFLPPA